MTLRKGDVLGVLLILSALASVAAVALAVIKLRSGQIKLDARGCPSDFAPVSVDAVLYDTSDVLSPIQLDWVRDRLLAWVRSVPTHGNVKIFTLSDPADSLKPSFDRCNPGSGDGANYWIANPARLKQRWETTFRGPAKDEIDKLPRAAMRRSPLLENIYALGVREGLQVPRAIRTTHTPTHRRLLLVSDLLQHTDALSLYEAGCALPSAFIGSSNWQSIRVDLSGLDVDVLLVRREGNPVCKEPALIRWWETVLGSLGATLASVEPLPGRAPASVVPEAVK